MGRIARGSFWNALATLLSRGLTFVAIVVAARLLGRELFGRFGILQAAITSFTAVGALGMGIAATKLIAERRTRSLDQAISVLTAALWIALVAGMALAGAVALSAPFLAEVVLKDAQLAYHVRIASLPLLFGCVAAAQTGVLAGFEAFASMAIINGIVGVVSLVALPILSLTSGLSGAIWALSLVSAAYCIANHFAIRATLARLGVRDVSYIRDCDFRGTIAVGIPAALATMLYLPANWSCVTLLARQPSGYPEVAVFTAVDQWFNIILTVPAVIGQVMLPVMSSVFSRGVSKDSRKLMYRALLANTLLAALPALLLIPLGPTLLGLYGSSYRGYALAFGIAVATASLASALVPAAQAIMASGKLWHIFAMNFAWAMVYIAATSWLVTASGRGALGLVAARAIAYSMHACLVTLYIVVALKQRKLFPASSGSL